MRTRYFFCFIIVWYTTVYTTTRKGSECSIDVVDVTSEEEDNYLVTVAESTLMVNA